MTAAARTSAAMLARPGVTRTRQAAAPRHETVSVSDAMLKRMRCGGLRPADAQRALRPRAHRGDAHGLGRSEREQRPEVHRVRERQVGMAAAERQLDLRRRCRDTCRDQYEKQKHVVEAKLKRRINQARHPCCNDNCDEDASDRRQSQEPGAVGLPSFREAQTDSKGLRKHLKSTSQRQCLLSFEPLMLPICAANCCLFGI